MDHKELKKSTFSGLFWKLSERVLAQFISLVVSIVLARLLTPDDYSVVGIVIIFFTFANVFISSGLNTSLIQKKNTDILDYSTVLLFTLAISISLYAVLFFSAPFISNLYKKEILIPVIRVMGFVLVINGIKSILCAYISNRLEFKKFFYATLGGTLFSGVVGIWMAIKGYGPWALVAQQMSNSLIDTVILFICTRFRALIKFSFSRLKDLYKFGWKIFVASIISVIYNEINPLVIGLKFSPSDLSFYTKGNSFPNLINATVGDTFSAVLFPVMAKFQDNKDELLIYTRRFMQVSSFVLFPLMLGFFSISDTFVKVVLTEKWINASPYIKIFCVSYMFNIIQNGNLQVIRAIGRSDIILKLEIIKKVSYFIVILLFILFANSPLALALATIVNTVIGIAVNMFPNRKLINYGYKLQLADISVNLLTSIIMSVIVYFIGMININDILLLFLQIVTGIIVYIILNTVLRNKNYYYFKDFIKSSFAK